MSGSTVNRLNQVQSYRLCALIESKYAEKCVCDAEFAKYAAEALGLPKLNVYHVRDRRADLGIPNSVDQQKAQETKTVIERLAAVEAAVQRLEKLAADLGG